MLTRKDFLTLGARASAAWIARGLIVQPASGESAVLWDRTAGAAQPHDALQRRIARVVSEYAAQGFHRSATTVDQRSAEWMLRLVEEAGARASLEPFPLERFDVQQAYVRLGASRIEGLPLFDGGLTDERGVTGRFGYFPGDAGIGLLIADMSTIGSEGQPIVAMRRNRRARALVIVTASTRPGLCPINAPAFMQPFGPPVLLVSSRDWATVGAAAERGTETRLVAYATKSAAQACNVIATVEGADPSLAPVVVMTPRSGWWACAAERGGGLACWFEAIRATVAASARRTVLFTANSGHELGHLGLEHYIARRPTLAKEAYAWVHLGAGIAGGPDANGRIQASDDEIERIAAEAMRDEGAVIEGLLPRGTIPGGEVRNIHVAGGRYVSVLGATPFFHNADDNSVAMVHIPAAAAYARAICDIVIQLAQRA